MISISMALVACIISNDVWPLDWNIYDVSADPEFSIIGYGDWCYPGEGAHPGVDFKDPLPGSANVISPSTDTTYVIAYDGGCYGSIVVLGSSPEDTSGWAISHLSLDSTWYVGDAIPPKEALAVTFDTTGHPAPPAYWFRHVHLMWQSVLGTSHGHLHPLDYLEPPAGYDSLIFRRIPYYEDSVGLCRGIIFDLQDDYPSLDENGYISNGNWHGYQVRQYLSFQDEVSEYVDFIVTPASADCIPRISDSTAGVRELSVDILRQDLNGEFSMGTWYGARTVAVFTDTIPFGDTPEYYDLFFDPLRDTEQPPDSLSWYFNTSYIASNTGCYAGPFETCYDNVWTSDDPADVHDWDAGEYNRGCWHTRMRHPDCHEPGDPDVAFVSENAAFPDGRYAVEVEATSHGGVEGSILLPKMRVLDPTSPTIGVLVNNFYPHVDSVVVYNGGTRIYRGGYETPEFVRPHEDERYFTSWFRNRLGSDYLEAEVKFSEPVEVDSVWIVAVAGPDTNWVSPMAHTSGDSVWAAGNGQVVHAFVTEDQAPEEYLGRLILNVKAHDLGLHQYMLDSNPETIPFPCNGGLSPAPSEDTCYEPGIAMFEWNLARHVNHTNWPYPCGEEVRGKKVEGGYIIYDSVAIDDAVGEPNVWSGVGIPNCTEGYGISGHEGYCGRYAGFWIIPLPNWVLPEYYDMVYICYPDASEDDNWNAVAFELPFQYGPLVDSIDAERNTGYQTVQNRQSKTPPGNLRGSWSGLADAMVTYSTGNYCFVAWNDIADPDSIQDVAHLTCISAVSNEQRHVAYPGGDVSAVSSPAGDSVQINVYYGDYMGWETYYYDPYSPEFFPEEAPDCIGVKIPLGNPEEGRLLDVLHDRDSDSRPEVTSGSIVRAGEGLRIQMNNIGDQATASIKLYDLAGRCSCEHQMQVHPGDNSIMLDIGGTPVGMYLLYLELGEDIFTEKVVLIQ